MDLRRAHRSRDYFIGGVKSPLLHAWSHSVEEQFYLVWPALDAARVGELPEPSG